MKPNNPCRKEVLQLSFSFRKQEDLPSGPYVRFDFSIDGGWYCELKVLIERLCSFVSWTFWLSPVQSSSHLGKKHAARWGQKEAWTGTCPKKASFFCLGRLVGSCARSDPCDQIGIMFHDGAMHRCPWFSPLSHPRSSWGTIDERLWGEKMRCTASTYVFGGGGYIVFPNSLESLGSSNKASGWFRAAAGNLAPGSYGSTSRFHTKVPHLKGSTSLRLPKKVLPGKRLQVSDTVQIWT